MDSKPGGLFFDFDGTLADSVGLMQEIYFEFLARFSRVGTCEEFERLNGPSLPEIISHLKAEHDLGDTPESLLHLYSRLIDEKYGQVAPMPGAMEALRLARKAGISVIIVTSNTRERVIPWLQSRLDAPLPLVIASGDGLRSKPWPDLYQKALTASQCEPSLSWAVEDSAHGQQAARSAGLNVLAYKPGQAIDLSRSRNEISDLRDALHFFQAHV